jgi:hypothetical protein
VRAMEGETHAQASLAISGATGGGYQYCQAACHGGLVSALGWLLISKPSGLQNNVSPLHPRSYAVLVLRHVRCTVKIPGTPCRRLFLVPIACWGPTGTRRSTIPVQNALATDDILCRFSAVWSAALLGEMRAISPLQSMAEFDVPFAA